MIELVCVFLTFKILDFKDARDFLLRRQLSHKL